MEREWRASERSSQCDRGSWPQAADDRRRAVHDEAAYDTGRQHEEKRMKDLRRREIAKRAQEG